MEKTGNGGGNEGKGKREGRVGGEGIWRDNGGNRRRVGKGGRGLCTFLSLSLLYECMRDFMLLFSLIEWDGWSFELMLDVDFILTLLTLWMIDYYLIFHIYFSV